MKEKCRKKEENNLKKGLLKKGTTKVCLFWIFFYHNIGTKILNTISYDISMNNSLNNVATDLFLRL